MEAEKLALVVDDGARVVDVNGYYHHAADLRYFDCLLTILHHVPHALRCFSSATRSPTSAMRWSLVGCDRASTMLVRIWSYRDIFDASRHASR